jgi:hypothetical protein
MPNIADAQHVIANPHLYPNRPTLRQLAMAVLMTAQGTPLRQIGPRAPRLAVRNA